MSKGVSLGHALDVTNLASRFLGWSAHEEAVESALAAIGARLREFREYDAAAIITDTPRALGLAGRPRWI